MILKYVNNGWSVQFTPEIIKAEKTTLKNGIYREDGGAADEVETKFIKQEMSNDTGHGQIGKVVDKILSNVDKIKFFKCNLPKMTKAAAVALMDKPICLALDEEEGWLIAGYGIHDAVLLCMVDNFAKIVSVSPEIITSLFRGVDYEMGVVKDFLVFRNIDVIYICNTIGG